LELIGAIKYVEDDDDTLRHKLKKSLFTFVVNWNWSNTSIKGFNWSPSVFSRWCTEAKAFVCQD